MDLSLNCKKSTYNAEVNTTDKCRRSSNNCTNTVEPSNTSNLKNTADSSISDDAMTAYKFLNRIKDSAKDIKDSSFASKYTFEYEAIQNEISADIYGTNTDKYKNLLDNAFKNAVTEASIPPFNSPSKDLKIKMSASNLLECEKQSETATGLVWMFKAEHKRILKEIEDYRKKKNHEMVTSLTQLGNTYKQVIDNISGTRDILKTIMNDNLNDDPNK
ncbi:hypothetical protein ACJDT4_15880 [Clostridium neuense]|uniref:DUF5082 domain-containing protein n=1 Tax=Clostridium neuense TaxID=1728934 RepID=A0ABW8TH92_9CLOT